MSSSQSETAAPLATSVRFSAHSVVVDLADGRSVSAPLDWYTRLAQASDAERSNWRLTGGGLGINWPDLDEDLSVEGLLAGRRSAESDASLARWVESRTSTG